ncbi:MAG: DNA internalization-related competence protein ComEC/Rec2 [Deltaproteobacteria bacterium]|nr:MAG: DNA internalization-related competence protein ComEC/Rec2 [Deltaproteobacteria bacterium]
MTPYRWVLRPLVVCILTWMAGLALGLWGVGSLRFGLGLFVVGLSWCLLAWWRRWGGWSLGLLSMWLAAGLLWGGYDRELRATFSGPLLQRWLGKKLRAEGWVVGRVERRVHPRLGSSCRVPFFLTRMLPPFQTHWQFVEARVLLKVRHCRRLVRGEGFRLRLQLREPRWYANPGNYNAREALFQRGIRWEASTHSQHMVLLARKSPGVWALWEQQRQQWISWVRSLVSNPSASSLLQALLLGHKAGISSSMRKDFARTGTSHLLAISGLHLAIVCSLFWGLWWWLFSWIPFLALRGWHANIASVLTFPGALVYAGLSGGAVSTQRALVMVGLFLLGGLLRRPRELANTLAIAALFVLLLEPTALFALSFQLSFGAVSVLALGHVLWFRLPARLEKQEPPSRLRKVWKALLASAFASMVASFALLPLTLVYFPQVPIWAPLANLVAVPLGGYLVVGSGLLALGVGCLSSGLGSWLLSWSAWFAEWLLRWVHLVACWPGSGWTLPPLRPLEVVGYIIAFVSLLSLRWLGTRAFVGFVCGITLLGIGVLQPASPPGVLQVQFLDVGQGDAALVRFPKGTTMLVDAGGAAYGQWDVGARVLLPTLRHLRVSHIDIAVLSHPHPDHFGGFAAVAEHLPIREFWHTGLSSRHPSFRKLVGVLKKKAVPMRWFDRSLLVSIDGVSVEILYPFPRPFEGKRTYWVLHANDNSVVMKLTWGKRSILFTGDIETRAEQILCQRHRGLKADVLKVPHHGSRTSSTRLLLDRVKPQHALFGVGRGNTFGFPHTSVLKRYQERNIRMWRTDLHGMITVQTDGESLRFATQLPSSPP